MDSGIDFSVFSLKGFYYWISIRKNSKFPKANLMVAQTLLTNMVLATAATQKQKSDD